MTTFFIIASSILTLASALPYIRDIIKGKTKPRVVSWFTWSLLTGIAAAASFSDQQYAAAILMTVATLETLAITVLGLKHGDRRFALLDIICQLSALAGLVLWQLFDSPQIAIIGAIAIDLVGALPTFKHLWQKPYEETLSTFAMASIAGCLTVLATASWQVTALAYPFYIMVINGAMAVIILVRKPYASLPGEPEELRQL